MGDDDGGRGWQALALGGMVLEGAEACESAEFRDGDERGGRRMRKKSRETSERKENEMV